MAVEVSRLKRAQGSSPPPGAEVLAFVGLGSNLGDRQSNIRTALDLVGSVSGLSLLGVSSFYECEPVGRSGQPDFINAVAEVRTSLSPRSLLNALQGIEKRMGRAPSRQRWGPRLIDLDILLYGNELVLAPDLVIPHALMHVRRFVLAPLCELEPDVMHPVFGLRCREILRRLRSSMRCEGFSSQSVRVAVQ